MNFNKNKFIKYSVVLLIVISLGIFINEALNKPTKLNYLIASKIYKSPANSAFVDDNFYKCVVDAYNKKTNSSVSYTTSLTDNQLLKITDLDCNGYSTSLEEKIENTQGIEKMVNITSLNLSNNNIKSINLNNLTKLSSLRLSDYDYIKGDNEISTIDLSKNINLAYIYLDGLGLNEINLSTLTNLFGADLSNNNLTNINLSNNNKMSSLDISNNKLELINVSNLENLSILDVSNNQLNNLNVTKNVKLTNLSIGKCGDHYHGSEVSYNSTGNNITSINLNQNTLLTSLDISANPITNLDVSKNTKLTYFAAVDSLITNIDFSKMLDISVLHLVNIPLEQINLSVNKNLINLYIINTNITKLNLPALSKLTQTNILNNKYMTEFSIETLSSLSYLYLSNNALSKLNIPSSNTLKFLDLSNNNLSNCNFNFSNLTTLYVSDNKCSNLDISNLPNVDYVDAENNLITKFLYSDSNTKNLSYLNLQNNKLITIDLSKFSNINGYSTTPLLLKKNDFMEEAKAIYVNQTVKVNDMVILPNYLRYSQTDWDSSNKNIATVDLSGLVTAVSPGQVEIMGTGHVSNKNNTYTTTSNIYVIEATSDKYEINAEEGYVYTGMDTDSKTILNNISLNYGKASIENNKLIIKYENEVVKEFYIVNFKSEKHDLTKDYIFEYEENNITINNGTINKNTNNNTLEIKYGEDILETYKLVEVNSEKYDLSNSTIRVQDNNINNFLDSINCVNCNAKIYDGNKYISEGDFTENNKLRIMYGEDVIKEYSLTFPVSGVTLNKESVKLGLNRKNTIQLEVIVNPNNATNKNVSWTSSNKDVATVDENGLVTSKGLGKTTITVTTEDGGFTDIVEIEVIDIITYQLTYKEGDTTFIEEYEENEVVELKKDVIKEGHTLIGWSYNNVKDYKLTDEFIMPAQDITLIAAWKPNTYKVTYEYLDETFDVTYNKTYGNLEVPTKKGYTFKGWYLEDTYKTEVKETTRVKTASDHTLYGKFEPNSYKLTIDPNGGEYAGQKEITLKYNSTTDISNPTKAGYKFKNWKLEGTESKIGNNVFTMGISDSKLIANWELVIPDIEKTSEYKVKENIITGISLGTTIESLDLGLDSIYEVKIYNKKQEIKTKGNIATSDKLKIYLGDTLVSEHTLSVKGDVTGTGTSTVSDVAKLYQYLKKKIDMEDCYKEAGNVVSTDNEIKINDVAKLYQFIKKKISSLED